MLDVGSGVPDTTQSAGEGAGHHRGMVPITPIKVGPRQAPLTSSDAIEEENWILFSETVSMSPTA